MTLAAAPHRFKNIQESVLLFVQQTWSIVASARTVAIAKTAGKISLLDVLIDPTI